VSAIGEAQDLAADHANQFAEKIPPLFGEDGFDLDDDKNATTDEEDDDRAGMLAAAFLTGGKRSVLNRFAKLSGAVLAGSLLADFAESIGSDSDSEDDIAAQMMDPIEGRAEMWVRTETGTSYGVGMMAVADEVEQKRWATIDPGCDEICHPADGQVVDMDDDFVMGDDTEVDYPPAHPNCDCTWLPWREQWGAVGSTDEIEEAA